MEEYVLLECNRLTAGIDESTDDFKNKWTNNVNSTGLVVSKGDMITMEAAAINTIGSTEDTMEFLGQDNENGYVDNKVTLDLAFYFNNAGKNLVSLPLRNWKSYLGYVLDSNDVASALLNRGLGEPDFNQATFSQLLPTQNLVYQFELSKTVIGTGFRINGIYNTLITSTPANGSGIQIEVLDVTTEGAAAGIPTKFRVTGIGNQQYPTSGFTFITTTAADGGINPATAQEFVSHSYLNPNFQSKNLNKPDGRRYYLGDIGYTGACQIDLKTGPQNRSPTFSKRVSSVSLEVPIGLSTPDNIATLLTEQLHRPTRLNTDFSQASFISGNNLDISTRDQYQRPVNRTPLIVETPTFKAMPCNSGSTSKGLGTLNNQKQFYNVVAYANPDKVEGLQYSRQFYYDVDNDHSANQIHSGDAQQGNRGDHRNQSVGNLGLCQVLMMNLPAPTPAPLEASQVNYVRGGWVVTNVYYTEENIATIARGFKKAERYFGDISNLVSNNLLTDAQRMDLAVPLDVGIYDDENSNGRPLVTMSGAINGFAQRSRYKTYIESATRPNPSDRWTAVDFDVTGCLSTVPFKHTDYQDDGLSPVFNDSVELPSLVVTSRWQDDYNFKLNPTDTGFTALHNIIEGETTTGLFSVSGTSLQDTFVKNYTDDLHGELSFDTMIGWAKDNDVAVIPVFPKPNTVWSKFGGRPFVAYRSHLPLGSGQYDVRVGGYSNWQIDKVNCPYGIQIGLDCSFTRLNACLVYNVNYGNKASLSNQNGYSNVLMAGAVNPNISFDPTVSRFEISGLNTPLTVGNGQLNDVQEDIDPTANPEQQIYSINAQGSIAQSQQDHIGGSQVDNVITIPNFEQTQLDGSVVDSISGIGINSITLENSQGSTTTLTYHGQGLISPLLSTTWNNNVLHNTVLGKMGFTIDQLLTRIGHPNGVFNNELTYLGSMERTIKDAVFNIPSPLTTGAFISSAEYQPTGVNSAGLPLYDCSVNNGLEARPSVSQGSITAFTLPQKLDYPYLCVYSSIVSAGTNTSYYGGSDGKSKVNCVGYITRFNNEGDFFYQVASDYNFTATKDFVLTDVDTDIRLPNGSRPKLQPHSSVIYKIIKPVMVGS